MRVLIINITRFGDTLQSQPLLHILKEQGHELGLICTESFVNAAQLLEGVNHLFPIPSSYILQHSLAKNQAWHIALQATESYVATIYKEFKPQAVINLTPTLAACLLAKKISLYMQEQEEELSALGQKSRLLLKNAQGKKLPSARIASALAVENQQKKEVKITSLKDLEYAFKHNMLPSNVCPVLGFGLTDTLHSENSSAWASYVEAVTLHRLSSPFNLSDGFTLLAGENVESVHAKNAHIRPLTPEIEQEVQALYSQLPTKKGLDSYSNNSLTLKSNIRTLGMSEQVNNTLSSKKVLKKQLPTEQYIPALVVNKSLEESNKEENLAKNRKSAVIAFQLGASEHKRQWSVKEFALLSQYFADKGDSVILLGAGTDKELAEEFYSLGGVAKNAINKTPLPILAGLLKQCDLLVTNDTGTMHLAAAVDVPIVAIFLATAQPWDTGAVSTDACFIEPNLDCHPCNFATSCPHDYKCKSTISYELIAEIIEKRLEYGIFKQCFSEKSRIWKSKRDVDGLLMLEPLDIIDKNPRLALFKLQRKMYKHLLKRIEKLERVNISSRTVEEQANLSLLLSCEDVDFFDKNEKEKLLSLLNHLEEFFLLLFQQAKLLGTVSKMSQAFLSTNQRIQDTFKSIPLLLPLAYMWQYGMERNADSLKDFFIFVDIVQSLISDLKQGIMQV